MSESHILNEEIVLEDIPFDYVEYSVCSWREWIGRAMNELEKVEVKEIKLLSYFSIIDMMAQEYFNYPTKGLQHFSPSLSLSFKINMIILDLLIQLRFIIELKMLYLRILR